jgi:nicotinate-nucleotide adenylyltransferase
MKIGILGGTFNPIHFGHLHLAERVREKLSLDKVIFIPANIPPHKDNTDIAAPKNRLKMIKLAILDNPCFLVSDIEIKREGVSYTIDTLKILRKKFKNAELFFIIGSDEVRGLNSWKDIENIKEIVQFVVAKRPGYSLNNLNDFIQIEIEEMDISGYQIRKRIREDKSIRYLVPEKVRRYILKRKLYRF